MTEKREFNGDTWRYQYNIAGLLEKVTRPDGQTVTFTYDPIGRRISKTHDGMRTRYYWDGDVVIHEVRIRLEDNGARLTTWVYDSQNPFTPVAKLTGTGKLSDLQSIHQNVYSITSNHLGTPTSMIDETGKKVWEETFDLWGKPHDRLETRVVGGAILTNVKPREETTHPEISQPFRFPGQYHDEETGLYYNRYRYYMPGEGMYTQRDPIGLAGGNPTVYGYVKNTLSQIDPFGLIPLNSPGFSVYGLFLAGSNEPYYIGITNNTIERARKHKRDGRMPDGSKMKVFEDNLTYGKARGFEQARIKHHGTLKGAWGKPISETNLGNKNNSFNIERTDERAKHFNKHRKDKLRELGGICR